MFEEKELIFYLVEKRQDRVDKLNREIERQCPNRPSSWEIEVARGEFSQELTPVLDELEERGATLAPTFAFLDPFGFSDLPMDLVSRLLSYRWCDMLITFNARDINRFAESPFHIEAIDQCLGGSGWRPSLPDGPEERRSFFITTYENEIGRRVPEAYVRSFEMSGMAGSIYYLVGATKHKEGVRVMKRAMWVTDPTGNYSFSDRTAGRKTLIEWEDEPAWAASAAQAVYERFAHTIVPVEEVEEFVLLATPWLFKKQPILGKIEDDGLLADVIGRTRRRTWPKGCLLQFR